MLKGTVQKILRNLIRIGEVSKINPEKGTVEVFFDDKSEIVTEELPMLAFEYYMPNPKDMVLCLFLGNGIVIGFCLGRYFCEKWPAYTDNEKIFYKDFFREANQQYNSETKYYEIQSKSFMWHNFDDTASIIYDDESKTMTLKAESIVCDGNIGASGTLTVDGHIQGNVTITSTERITGKEVYDELGNLRS